MLFAATSTNDLLAAVGAVSTDVFESTWPYLLIAAGIPLAFYLVKKLISLIPKGR